MAEELIDIYDEKMNLLGTATREQAHREGLWHTSFHCWIVRRSPEGRPQVLLQIRGKTQNHPSLIDISSAGHLAAGETAHDGIKNIEQELGLKVDFGKLVKLFTANHVFQIISTMNLTRLICWKILPRCRNTNLTPIGWTACSSPTSKMY